jgi:hypothetical protein
VYYLMQAPREHPSGYTTTAPIAADVTLRSLQKKPCPYLARLGITIIVTHYKWKDPCGGHRITHDGVIGAYRAEP